MKTTLNKFGVGSSLACAFVLSIGLISSPTASALDVTVNPGGNIQAALDQVGNAGGGTVFVNSGTYNVTASVQIPNNTTLWGKGSTRPVIQRTGSTDTDIIRNKSIPFTNVKVDYIAVNGGCTDAQMDGGTYKERNGMDISDQHNTVANNGAYIVNSTVTRSYLGINVGRTTNVTLKGTTLTNNGGLLLDAGVWKKGFIHHIYISSCDKILVENVNGSNCRSGMGLKITDFYGNLTETSVVVRNNTFDSNYDRGIAVYDTNPLVIEGNKTRNNLKSGINLFRTTSGGRLVNNVATGNGNQPNVAYDIWLNACSGFTISVNTYVTKNGF
ncbi:right-handed parallel beta-helix repeat-containing protein [Oleiharenicola lentus]|uniref:right-handed parallel beta-helix repeat-containing protein n=1 Tax=Oleiharenicola lentus TaxID=2508720 RepID=UPI003F66E22B